MPIQPIRKDVLPEIPDKLYFRIGDVARICEVPAYVLRFWETEFQQLRPNKGGTGQRLYRKRDVEMALRIKSLLYDQGYTIPGARQVFKTESNKVREVSEVVQPPSVAGNPVPTESPAGQARHSSSASVTRLRKVQGELQQLLTLLERPVAGGASEGGGSSKTRLEAIRPRLMAEPRMVSAPAAPMSGMRLVKDTRLQGDLFPAE